MNNNFKCPKCKTKSGMGKHLHAKWTCPHCKNSIVPTRENRTLGYVPFKFNAMYAEMTGYKRKSHTPKEAEDGQK